jgi:4-diphosphocytidyl-2-C-methyl-D-erythritol kinase
VSGPPSENLAARALAAFRDSTGWDGPPVRLSITKRVPVAAGLGGGSADAAAALRLVAAAAGQSGPDSDARLQRLAAELGSDVPALVRPGRWLVTGTGEHLEPLGDPVRAPGVVVLPAQVQLGTADVYARADRLSPPRSVDALPMLSRALRAAFGAGDPMAPGALLANDLEAAARSLCPAIDDALRQLRTAGSDIAFVSGSGPTVVGLFCGDDGADRAQRAAVALSERVPAPIAATTADAQLGLPSPLLGT